SLYAKVPLIPPKGIPSMNHHKETTPKEMPYVSDAKTSEHNPSTILVRGRKLNCVSKEKYY
ncbi:MAG: hypothetical protein IKW54_00005, partial [Bacteroidales bacterium]|nr:hypothetical protein [Bacteroidales bacterium]